MKPDGQLVRLVVLGGATGAPVCEGDVCDLPDSTVASEEASPRPWHQARPGDVDDQQPWPSGWRRFLRPWLPVGTGD